MKQINLLKRFRYIALVGILCLGMSGLWGIVPDSVASSDSLINTTEYAAGITVTVTFPTAPLAGEEVRLYKDATILATDTTSDGAKLVFTFTISNALNQLGSDGSYSLEARHFNGTVEDTGVSDAVTLDTTAPTGYSVDITPASYVNATNVGTVSFAFTGAEVGATYDYSFTGTSGGPLSGTNTIATATDTISPINLATLGEGAVSLSVTLTDPAGNIGATVVDAVTKDVTLPTFSPISIVGSGSTRGASYATQGTTITVSFTASETISGATATINGEAATVTNIGGNNWTASCTLAAAVTSGSSIAFSINSFTDDAGNTGVPVSTTSDASALTGYNTLTSTGGDANTAATWTPNALPSANDILTVTAGTINQTGAVSSYGLTNAGTWDTSGQDLTVGPGNFTNTGTLVIAATGAISVPGSLMGGTVEYTGTRSMLTGKSYTNLAVSGGTITGISSTVSGTMNVSGGNLSIPNGITVTLNGASNTVTAGTLTLATGGIVDAGTNPITISGTGVLDTSGTLNCAAFTSSATIINSATNTINTSGSVNISGTFSSSTNSTITMTGSNNLSATAQIGNLTVPGTVTITGSALSLGGNLSITGSLSNGFGITVAGTTTINIGAGNSISLTNANNDFQGAVSITSANNMTLVDTNSIILGPSNVNGSLGVTSTGNITQSGILIIGSSATFAPGATGFATLNTHANNFATVITTNGVNAAYQDSGAIILGANTITGNLDVAAGGNITQSGVLSVGGTTTLTLSVLSNINISTSLNKFDGTITITNNTFVRDLSIRNATGTAGIPVFCAGLRDVVLTWNNSGLIFPALTITGTLQVTTTGDITQTGALIVPGIATFAPGAAYSTNLNSQANNFSTVVVTNGTNAAFLDSNTIILDAITVTGTFAVSSTGVTTNSTISAASVSLITTGAVDLNGTITASGGFSSSGTTFDNTGATITTSGGAGAIVINHTNNVTIGDALTSAAGIINIAATDPAATISLGAAINSTTGNVTVDSAGTTTILTAGDVTCSSTGSVSFGATGAGSVATAGDVTTADGNIQYYKDVALSGNCILTSGNATIQFDGSVSGAQSLTVNSGSASTTFTGAVGSTALASLTITNSGALTFSNSLTITGPLIQSNPATGLTTFTGSVSTGSATLRGIDYTLSNSFTSAGSVSVTNSGIFTKDSTGIINVTGASNAFSTSGAANLANNITTNAGNITIGSTLVIAESTALTISSGASAGDILFSGTVDGTTGGSAETITVNAGTGTATFSLSVGSGATDMLTVVTVTNSASLSFNSTLNITGTLVQTNAAPGLTTFTGAVSTGSATLRGTDYTIANSFTSVGTVSVTNSGIFTKGAVGIISVTGAGNTFSTTGSANLANSITTNAGTLTIGGNLVLADTVTVLLSTGAGTAGDIIVTGATNGTTGNTGETLNLTAGTGTITLTGTIGAVPLEVLTINSATAVSFPASVTTTGAQNITATTITTNGTHATTASSISLTGNVILAADSVLNSTNGAVTLSGTLLPTALNGQGLTVNADSGLITITGPIGTTSLKHLILNSTNASGLSLPQTGASAITVTSGGAVSQTGTLTGTTLYIKTLWDAGSAITLDGTNNFSTVTFETRNASDSIDASGNISYTDTNGFTIGSLGASSAGIRTTANSALTSGAAVIQTGQIISSGLRLIGTGPYTLTHASNNITTLAANLTAAGALLSYNDEDAFSVGTVTTAGITTNGGNLSLTTTTLGMTISNSISTGAGTATFDTAAGGTITLSVSPAITTADATINFQDPVILASSTDISTGAGAGNISFASSLTGSNAGLENLDLTAGTGSVIFTGPVGATRLGVLSILSANAGVTANSTISVTSVSLTTTGSVDLNGTITASGGFSSTGTTFDNTGATITTSGGAGSIVIDHTGNVTIGAALTSATGIINIDATDPAAIIFLGAAINSTTGNITADSGGATTILAAGDVTCSSTGWVSFGATGAGSVTTAGDVTTAGGYIRYYKAVILSASVALNTGASVGDITFNSTLALSTNYLTLNAGTGALTFDDVITGTPSSAHVRILGASSITGIPATISFPFDVFVDASGSNIIFNKSLSCRDFIFYQGTINLNALTLSTSRNFVVFGTACNFNDADYSFAANTRFEYFGLSGFAYFPGGGTYATVNFATTASAAFDNLTGSTITVAGNFYNNGSNMNGAGNWTLNIPSNSASTPVYNATTAVTATQWGTPYAVAFNMAVSNSTATGGTVAAPTISAGAPDAGNHHTVTYSGANTGWNFIAPRLTLVETVYDNVLRLTFDQAIENSNNEITSIIGNILTNTDLTGNANAKAFTGAFIEADCTVAHSTDGKGDLAVFYIQTTNTRWNTDATGTSGGDLNSTDRSNVTQSTLPNLTIPLGALRSADGKTFIRNHGNSGLVTDGTSPIYTDTIDLCRPVLVTVSTGQELHVVPPTTQAQNDAHNFIELKWSEPVDITNLAIVSYIPSSDTFDGTSSWGGQISGSSGLSVSGYITTENGALMSESKTSIGTGTPDPTIHALYRTFSLDGTAPVAQPHRLRISVAGWCPPITPRSWPGFIDSATTPSGLVTVLPNAYIHDLAVPPNELEPTSSIASGYGTVNYVKADVNVYSTASTATPFTLYGPWDTTPPDLAGVKGAATTWAIAPAAYEAIPSANLSAMIEYLELHFFDNKPTYNLTLPTDSYMWQSKTGWYTGAKVFIPTTAIGNATAAETFGGSRPLFSDYASITTSGGIRDSSLTSAMTAFTVTPNTGAATAVAAIDTTVNSPFMSPSGSQSLEDDPYFRLQMASYTWPIGTTSLTLSYTKALTATDSGFVTDLAGNRLDSFSGRNTLDRTPPKIALTLAGAQRNDFYMLFTKPITLADPALAITDSVKIMIGGTPAVITNASLIDNSQAILFTLQNPLMAADILNPNIANYQVAMTARPGGPYTDPDTGAVMTATYFQDDAANYVSATDSHRITDLAIGIVDILYGADGVNTNELLGTNEGALRTFDGTGRLLDKDITIATRLTTDPAIVATPPLTLYFDVSPGTASMPNLFNMTTGKATTLWLPSILSYFNSALPVNVRSLSPINIVLPLRLFRNFLIPESDPEMIPGSRIEMVFKYGDLYCARLTNPSDITSFAPWSFNISETKKQRGGVTILNNVIDSNKREQTVLQVEVSKAGNIVIQVFTMDGNVVKVLDRGRRGGGTYNYYWDGTNGAGEPVARGIYFIRVVGPDMDEIRKVMVVKE